MYAALDAPIKHFSSELLYKLEGDMFPKASVGDDRAGDDRVGADRAGDEEIDNEGNR